MGKLQNFPEKRKIRLLKDAKCCFNNRNLRKAKVPDSSELS